MVEGLSKRITGDWAEVGRASLSLSGLLEYFSFPEDVFESIAARVSDSVEQGILEYKESILQSLFNVLEDMKYKSIGFDVLNGQQAELSKLLFVTLLQRLFASGLIVSGGENAAAAETKAEKDLKLILADVMAQVRDNPALKSNTSVKKILTQLAIYQRERETMEKLSPNIKEEQKRASFRQNFRNTFRKISENIQKYYNDFLEESRKEAAGAIRISLAQFPLRELLTFFTKQAREFLRIRSTIAFALEGQYKVREICIHILNEKKTFSSLIDQEGAGYQKISGVAIKDQEKPSKRLVSMAFASEIAAVMRKTQTREKVEDGEAAAPNA
jgi:hypothetical protein